MSKTEPSEAAMEAAARHLEEIDGAYGDNPRVIYLATFLDAFAARAVEAEREACAVIAEAMYSDTMQAGKAEAGAEIAAAIRERSTSNEGE